MATVAASQYVPALYDANSSYTDQNGQQFRDAPVIRNRINGNPCTWVSWKILNNGQFIIEILNSPAGPPGVTTNSWSRDLNGDVAPIALQRYSQDPAWDFADFANVWQFFTDWPTAGATIITDQGTAYPLSQIAPGFDFSTSLDPDPAHANGSRLKHDRRTRVTRISASNATIQSGATITLTITLDRNAPAPNGTLVILRCDSSDITVPSAARVPARAISVDVTAAAVVGASAATVHISSRTLYQLTDAPAITTLTITA